MARAAPESRQQARSALAGDLSWGRLGRIALLQDTSEILPKTLAEASLSSLSPSWGSFSPSSGSFGASWGSFETSWVSFWAPGALPERSREPLGSLLGPPKTSKIVPGGSPGGPPHRSSIFEAFWGSFWLHFWTPRTSKNKVFVWRVLQFSKNRGVRKNT